MRAASLVSILLIGAPIAFPTAQAQAQAPSPSAARDASPDSPRGLQLQDVLASARAHHPLIAVEMSNVEAARGDAFAARGEFDTVLSVTGRAAPQGYYDGRRLDVLLEQPTPLLGASLYAGYRVSRGNIAPYYGEQNTLRAGELRAGVRMPLLQDLRVDSRRAAVRATAAQERAEAASYEDFLLEIERHAAQAYITWVAASKRASVIEGLVALANQRDAQIREKVALGAVPPIEQLDNMRSLLDRQRLLIVARRSLEKAAIDLSLFSRDRDGNARVPESSEVPPDSAELKVALADLDTAQRTALARRPELRSYAAQVEAANVETDLAQNRTMPRLDAFAEVSKDFGATPERLRDVLGPVVVEVGATLSMPLWLRKARGKLRAAEAKLDGVREKSRFARDKIVADVGDAWSQYHAALERARVASAAAAAADQVAQGERERFELGATTVLFVNLREQSAADAKIAYVDALAEYEFSAARLLTLTGHSLVD